MPSGQITGSGTEPWASTAASLVDEHGCAVVGWRSSMTGRAWPAHRQIEAPKPRSLKSFLILAHEVGHVAAGHRNGEPRWLQEVEAWEFALQQVIDYKLKGPRKAMEYATPRIAQAFWRAIRRGADAKMIKQTCPDWWRRCRPLLIAWGLSEDELPFR